MAEHSGTNEHGAESAYYRGRNAQAYATFRPEYPPHIYQLVLDFAQLAQRALAVDLGAGSGQATRRLASFFDKVIGIDASADQLSHASLPENVEMRRAPAEATGLPDHSVDLVTAAAALHWFDRPAVYREARRILKPGGAFAAWTYTGMETRFIPESPAAEKVRLQLVYEEFLPIFHPKLQRILESGYEGFEPDSQDFEEVKFVRSEMEVELTVAQMVGIVQTWSAFLPWVEKHGEEATAKRLQKYRDDLMAALGVEDDSTPVIQVWPVDIVLARRPVPLQQS